MYFTVWPTVTTCGETDSVTSSGPSTVGVGAGWVGVGAVWVDVDHRYFNDNSGYDRYATIDLQPGYQKLSGRQALDYVRFRHTDSDLHRNARQQDFVGALRARPVGSAGALSS